MALLLIPRWQSQWLLLLVLLSLTLAEADLNVWLERQTLSGVFDWMQFLTAKNPLRARCKARTNTEQHRALTLNEYPLITEGVLLSNPQVDSLSKVGIALAHNVNSLSFGWSNIGADASDAHYRFLRLKSHNITMLDEPTLSITSRGYVPNAKSSFEVRLHCSQRISGITGFEIHVVFDWPQHPKRRLTVLQRYFKKACLSSDDLTKHERKCHCRSQCERLLVERRQGQPATKLRHKAAKQRRRCQKRCQRLCRRNPGKCFSSNEVFN